MKKNIKSYALIWAIFLVAFNAVVFLVRPIIPGYEIRYDARFWIAWVFVIAAFVGNLVCANAAFKAENLQKLFYNVPLITVSYSGLILMLVLGAVLMLIPNCPAWIAAVVCVAVAAFTAVAVVKAGWAAEAVTETHEKVAQRTQFIKLLTVEAETLMSKAKTPEAQAAAKKVYEAVRYSDPMSSDVLTAIEAQIADKMAEFIEAINSDDTAGISTASDNLILLLNSRNRKCKAMK